MQKSIEKSKNQAAAGRMEHLRKQVFALEGFGYHDKPTVAQARAMANRNVAKLAGDGKVGGFKTPTVSA
jgi:hypothetical protein